jgi:hypothetical protein
VADGKGHNRPASGVTASTCRGHALPSETLEYERYVDGLRRSNAQLTKVMRKAWKAIAADLGMIRSPKTICLLSEMDALIARAKDGGPIPVEPKTITVHLEEGRVMAVNGVPHGVEVHIEDYDHTVGCGPYWDEKKGCDVTVYGVVDHLKSSFSELSPG